MKKVAAIVQARVSSTRLPKKILKDIVDKPLLWHLIMRLKSAKQINQIIIATTSKKEDNSIVKLAKETAVESFRGSEEDVLDRYYQAAKKYKVEIIVRITADCPLADPKLVDKIIKCFLNNNFDYISNVHPPTYPDGLDVEVFSFETLKKVWKEAKKASEREHVTPYILNHHRMFRISNIENEVDLSYMRWTVDEERDLKFVKEIYRRLYKNNKIFYMEDILNLLKNEPELSKINRGISRNEGYAKSLKEDRE